MSGKMISAIDIHSHYNSGSDGNPESPIYTAQLDTLRALSQAAGIESTCYSTFSSVLSPQHISEGNRDTSDLCQQNKWAYQWVVIDPRMPETFEQADELLSRPQCVGIKIHPQYHRYSILDYADKLFSFAAQRKATILMHPHNISDMPRFADQYPSMNLIIAHLGSVEHIDAIEAATHGNIYVDTSGIASSNNQIIEYAVGRVGSSRILFGTDTYAPSFQRGRIEYALISEKDKKNILRNNALTLFPGCFL